MLGSTPMMKQYQEIKNAYKDCILFYRLGDFYEMFGPDAEVASKVLDIALTSREAGKGNRIPMCGVPFHSAETYIAKLIRKDYKVAICEQIEDPKSAKGIVKRDVIKIITPGTVLNNNILKEKSNNFLVSVAINENVYGLAAVDISTGDFYTTEIENKEDLLNEVLRFDPAECIISQNEVESKMLETILKDAVNINYHLEYAFKIDYCQKLLLEHFNVNSLQSLGCQEFIQATRAAGAALDYLLVTQKSSPSNLTRLKVYNIRDTMYLDYATKKNLELTQSINSEDKKNSLLSVLDHTVTSLGARMLKSWLEKPLIIAEEIQNRLDATEEFYNDSNLRLPLRKLLNSVYDLERISAKISFGSANAKDLLSLKNSLFNLPDIKKCLKKTSSFSLKNIHNSFDDLADIHLLLENTLSSDPPFSLREGNLIKDNCDEEVDRLRNITQNGKEWILGLEQAEKNKSGIKSLKIGYNKVFGYYIEVTKSNLHLVPDDYIRKQTLANAERYITPELKEKEAQVIGADDQLKNLEYQLFVNLRDKIKEHTPRILDVSKKIAELDCLTALADVAISENYVKPQLSSDGTFNISKCRHPVVEKNLEEQWFIPNDINLNSKDERFLIITGPNMGGKSTYCRSVAIASILMQIGSFIPAEIATLPIVDRVFARVGANDNLSTGQSTFMVEMSEVANIINNATANSLIILDEVGRGTSTYDGLSIAWALTEYIHTSIKAKTLFATHYHELIKLENELEGVKNYCVSVKEEGEDIVFVRKIISGAADKSYGIQVAKLAGLPNNLIKRANDLLSKLEKKPETSHLIKEDEIEIPIKEKEDKNSVLSNKEKDIINELQNLDLVNTTPLQAINILYNLQKNAKSED